MVNEQTKKDLSTLRILVAEGDQINLVVLRHLLKKGGCTFDLAVSKSEILEKHSRYDLLLLDLDSSQFDAAQTISEIRSLEKPNSHRLRIFGLSNSEPNQGIEIDFHLQRPAKWTEFVEGIDLKLISKEEQKPNGNSSINLETLFESFGNSEMVSNILKLFIAQTPDNMKQLDDFLLKEDWNAFGTLSHNMKSVYALIGLGSVKNYFDEMERDCNAKNINVQKFKNYLVTIKEENATAIAAMEKTLLENAG